MLPPQLHRFEIRGKRFVMDTRSCFCFECDEISWDVLEYYPREPVNRVVFLLKDRYSEKELEEVIGELEWLRITKAILTPPDDQKLLDQAMAPAELARVTVCLDASSSSASELISGAGGMLIGASGRRQTITLSLKFPEGWGGKALPDMKALEQVRKTAMLSGKTCIFETDLPLSVPAVETVDPGCRLRCRIRFTESADLTSLSKMLHSGTSAKIRPILKAAEGREEVALVQGIVQPGSAQFDIPLRMLKEEGFKSLRLDIPALWVRNPGLDPGQVAEALGKTAHWYAESLLRREPFRLEPVAVLFKAIHEGEAHYHTDGAGVRSLVVDSRGDIYPSPEFLEKQAHCFGNLFDGTVDRQVRESFQLANALNRPVCLQCWAQGLCGGGHAAIHFARTGEVRTPDPAWCDAQRQWIGMAVAAFTPLSGAGVNLEQGSARPGRASERPSLFTLAKALITGHLGVRPLLESDAPWLVRWENWNDAAYFVCTETGALTATQYDREMDALHPRELLQELVITQRDGSPCGLVKVQLDPVHKVARAWLYMRDPALYAKSALRTTLGALLAETCRSKMVRHVVAVATQKETGLAAALQGAGFEFVGVEREALYRRGKYEDVNLFRYRGAE